MKAVLALAVLVAVVAVSAAGRWPMRSYYRDEYEYDYWGRRRPMDWDDRRHGRQMTMTDDHDEMEVKVDEKIYHFAISEDDLGPYMYHDEEGYAKGFELDLMKAVCEHAHKTCYAILDKNTHCWYFEEGHNYPGMGLMAGWFDGCMGFFPTVERKNSFDFTHSFTENLKVALWFKKEAGLMKEDTTQLANRKIGFLRGWPTSQSCLEKQTGFQGNHIGEYTAVMFDDIKTMVATVMNGEVDAVMAPRALGLAEKGLVHTDHWFQCTTDGAALMVSQGSKVMHWWDQAFEEMKESGEFRRLCRKAEREHGHKGTIYCN